MVSKAMEQAFFRIPFLDRGIMQVPDSLNMFGLVTSLPDQARHAVAQAQKADMRAVQRRADSFAHIAVLGMGGSGIAGAVLQTVAAANSGIPVSVHRGYQLPAFIGPRTFVFAVSCSGETEEVLESAETALARGATLVAVTSGGALARLAADAGAPVIFVPGGVPPRTQMAAMSFPLVVISERLGILPAMRDEIDDAFCRMDVLVAKMGETFPDPGSPVARVARALDRKITLVYGSEGPGEVAAYRWKCQINENAKAPAFVGTVPELNHNEIVGWGQHGDVTRQVCAVVELRHDLEHPQNARRFTYERDLIEEVVSEIVEVRAEASTCLGVIFELGLFGDFVSLSLAWAGSVDPGPVPVLTDLKERLASSEGLS